MTKPASEYITATKQFFGDGEYWLLPKWKYLLAFEEQFRPVSKMFAGLLESFYDDNGSLKLLGYGDIRPHELNEIVRIALIGGNCGPEEGGSTEVGPQRALRLVNAYGALERPLEEVGAVAFRILYALIHGDPAQMKAGGGE